MTFEIFKLVFAIISCINVVICASQTPAKYSFSSECDTFPIVSITGNSSSSLAYALQLSSQNITCSFASNVLPPQTSSYRSVLTSVFGNIGTDAANIQKSNLLSKRTANVVDIELLLRFTEFFPMLVKNEVYIYDPYVTALAHMTPLRVARDSSERLASSTMVASQLRSYRATCFYTLISTRPTDRLAKLSIRDEADFTIESCIIADWRNLCALRVVVPKSAQSSTEDETLLTVRYAVMFTEGVSEASAECPRISNSADNPLRDSDTVRLLFEALIGVDGGGRQADKTISVFSSEMKAVRFRRFSPVDTSKLGNEQVTLIEPAGRVRAGHIFPVQLVARTDVTDFQITIRTKQGQGLNYVALNRRSGVNNWNWNFTVEVEPDQARPEDITYKLTAIRTAQRYRSKAKPGQNNETNATVSWRLLSELLFEVDQPSNRGSIRLPYTVTSLRSNPVVLSIGVSNLDSNDPVDIVTVFKRDRLLNLAVLNGQKQTFRLRVVGIFVTNGAYSARELVTPSQAFQIECSSDDREVIEVATSCGFLYFQGIEKRPRMNARIVVRYRKNVQTDQPSDLQAEFFVNVFMPKSLIVHLSDNLLSPISNWMALPKRVGSQRESDQSMVTSCDATSLLQTQVATVQLLARFYSIANISQTDADAENQGVRVSRTRLNVARDEDASQANGAYRVVELFWPPHDSLLAVTHLFEPTRIKLVSTTPVQTPASTLRVVRDGNATRLLVVGGRVDEALTLKVLIAESRRPIATHDFFVRSEPVQVVEMSGALLQFNTASRNATTQPALLLAKRSRVRLDEAFELTVDYDPLRTVRLFDIDELPNVFYLDLRVRFDDQSVASLYDFDADSYTLNLTLNAPFSNVQLRLARTPQRPNSYYYVLFFEDSSVIKEAGLTADSEFGSADGKVTLQIGEVTLRGSLTRDSLRNSASTSAAARFALNCSETFGTNASIVLASASLELLVEVRQEEVAKNESINLTTESAVSTGGDEQYDYEEEFPVNSTGSVEENEVDRLEALLDSTTSTPTTSKTTFSRVVYQLPQNVTNKWWRMPDIVAVGTSKKEKSVDMLEVLSSPLAIALFCVVGAGTLSVVGMLVYCTACRPAGRPPFRFVKSCAKRAAGSGPLALDTEANANAEWMWISSSKSNAGGKRSKRDREPAKRESATSLLRRSASDATGCTLPCSVDVLPASLCSNDDLPRDRSTPISITFSNGSCSASQYRAQYSPDVLDGRPISAVFDTAAEPLQRDDALRHSGSMPRRTRLGTSSFAYARSPTDNLNVIAYPTAVRASSPRLVANPMNGNGNGTYFTLLNSNPPDAIQNGVPVVMLDCNRGSQGLVPDDQQQYIGSFISQPAFANQHVAMFGNLPLLNSGPISAPALTPSEQQIAAANRLSRIAEHSDEEEHDGVPGSRKKKQRRLPDVCRNSQQPFSNSDATASATMHRHCHGSNKQHRHSRNRQSREPAEGTTSTLLSSFPVAMSGASQRFFDPEHFADLDTNADRSSTSNPTLRSSVYGDASYLLPTSVYATMTRKPTCRAQPAHNGNLPCNELKSLTNAPVPGAYTFYGGGMKESYT